MRIFIKALSVNRGWQGRRFKNKAYRDYEREILYLLPKRLIYMPTGKLELNLVIGLSSRNADVSNCEKFFTDILCLKYNFDDKWIYRLTIEREDVKKGKEFIDFEIKKYN